MPFGFGFGGSLQFFDLVVFFLPALAVPVRVVPPGAVAPSVMVVLVVRGADVDAVQHHSENARIELEKQFSGPQYGSTRGSSRSADDDHAVCKLR